MKNKYIVIVLVFGISLLISNCKVIRPGEVGLKQTLGRLHKTNSMQGPHLFNPFITKYIVINIRTVELYETLPLPTKEGLSVNAQITLLYHVNPDSVRQVYKKFGINYEEVIVNSNFLATAREVSSRYFAKELYAIEREKVEKVVAEELKQHISKFGFEVDAVLLKDIILPPSMVDAIQKKVNAEQDALQMDFVIAKQQKEAERLRIEAEGIKRAQNIIDSSLTNKLLQYNQIQALKSLMNNSNSKVIITNGQVPSLLNLDTK